MTVRLLGVALAVTLLASVGPLPPSSGAPGDTLPRSRPFSMGVTPWPHDFTPEAIDQAYAFTAESTDLNVHHFDEGIPWPEALDQKPYPANVEDSLQLRVGRLRADRQTYIAATAARDSGLAGYWGQTRNLPLPEAWRNKAIDDPDVIRAYLSFCRDLINRFHPGYMAYGIEVNTIAKNSLRWARFVTLAKEVYGTLKEENPTLRLFVTLQVDEYWQDEAHQRDAVAQILPYTDYIAVSAYPYLFGHHDPQTLPADFFSRVRELAPAKPFAVAETGFTAKDVEAFGKSIPGTEAGQNAYLTFVLGESARLHAEFVVWFFYRDYDALWDRIKFLGPDVEIFKAFKNTGLLDSKGRDRPASSTWRTWLRLPRQ